MKAITIKILFTLLGFQFLVPSALAEEESLLDKMLTERIKVNEKYRDEFAEEAEETTVAKDLVPLEKKVGQAWVDHLVYLRSLKDVKLKKQFLQLELLSELTNSYYDLEYAEGLIQKASARSKIAKWKKQIARLNSIDDKGNAVQPVKPEAKPATE